MSFVLIHHGWTNTRQPGHWQRNLAVALRAQGHHVSYAQYPETQQPEFADWSTILVAELELLVEQRSNLKLEDSPQGELILIGHSLGCVNIMKSALEERIRPELRADRTLFVAPAGQTTLDKVSSFKFALTDDAVRARLRSALSDSAGALTLVASDDDPWLPGGILENYGEPLGLDPVIIEGAKHLALTDGWGTWQGVIDWVNNSSADLKVR